MYSICGGWEIKSGGNRGVGQKKIGKGLKGRLSQRVARYKKYDFGVEG